MDGITQFFMGQSTISKAISYGLSQGDPSILSLAISGTHWLEVPIPFFSGLCLRPMFPGISPQNMAEIWYVTSTSICWILKISHWSYPIDLVGGIPTPLKNMKVSWDYSSQYMIKNVPNHQPVILRTPWKNWKIPRNFLWLFPGGSINLIPPTSLKCWSFWSPRPSSRPSACLPDVVGCPRPSTSQLRPVAPPLP